MPLEERPHKAVLATNGLMNFRYAALRRVIFGKSTSTCVAICDLALACERLPRQAERRRERSPETISASALSPGPLIEDGIPLRDHLGDFAVIDKVCLGLAL